MRRGLRIGNGINLGWIDLVPRRGGGADVTSPTITISCSQISPTIITPLNMSFVTSEQTTDFTIGDITVVGGVASNFAGSGQLYTCDISVTGSTVVTVDVAAGTFHDAAGNANMAATQFSITFINLLLRDDFITPVVAPMPSPHTCEPGPGKLVITDTSGSFASISSGLFVLSGVTASFTDPKFVATGSYAATNGRCTAFLGTFSPGANWRMGIQNNFQVNIPTANGQLTLLDAGAGPNNVNQPMLVNTSYNIKFVTNPTHIHILVGNKLMFPMKGPSANMAPTYVVGNAVGNPISLDSVRVADLGGAWTGSYGIATNRLASPVTGSSLAHEVDGFAEFQWVVGSGETANLWIRQSDANNGWKVSCSQPSGTIQLIEVNSGNPIVHHSAAQTWVTGSNYRIVALAEGNTLISYANLATNEPANKNIYVTGTFNNTATLASVDGFTSGSNFATWPRNIGGDALARLNAINP